MTPALTDAQILDQILLAEGGFVDHPADHGHATHFGITQATLSQWRGHDASLEEIHALTVDEARAIYQAKYLQPFAGMPPDLKPHLVDIAVNAGVGRAKQLLERAGAQVDRPVAVQLVIERLKHYAAIVRTDPTQAVFMVGWVNRAVRYL